MANVIQSKRKRDKRKKKEEVIEEFHQPIPNITDDLNIHVHKEVTTGGGLCAKLIFFALLIILSTLIGLLITEHRGLSDGDTLNTETAFGRILEGWIDTNPEYHEEVHSVERSHNGHDDDDILDDDEDDLEPSRSMFEEDEEEDEGELSRDQDESKTVSEEDDEEEEEYDDREESETQEQVYESESESLISSLRNQKSLETNEEEGEPSVVSKDEQESEDEDEEANLQSDISERVHEKIRQVEQIYAEDDAQDEEKEESDELLENVISNVPQTVLPEGAEEVEQNEKELQLQSETTETPTDNEKGDGSSNSEKITPLTRNSDSEDDSSWPEKRSGANNVYDFSNITNVEDWKIREELDEAGNNLTNDPAYALILFNKILEKQPFSPRATYGKAQSFDVLAEKKKSNKLLEESIITYQQVLKIKNVPDILFQMAADRVINRMRFRGVYTQIIPIHKLLVSKFPDSVDFQNELAVTYLTMNNFYEAKRVLYDVLLKWPEDGFAMVNYGFILKLHDLDLKQAVKYLKKGIATGDPGVIDGRFYYHLGDALIRMGRKEEASIVHLEGVNKKVFLSMYQRSLHNVNRLTGKPWWKKEDMSNPKFFEKLEQHWKIIRDEGMSLLDTDGLFKTESEDLREIGDWKQFELYARGIKNVRNCKLCPRTCQLIEMFPDAVTCKRGQIKFSVVQPGTHVWPHCGPTNCRLRSHLGLKVPSNVYIRVADEIRSWKEGKLLIFDDSFEHEIWHNGSTTRLILIVDFWHPQLTKEEKLTLSSV